MALLGESLEVASAEDVRNILKHASSVLIQQNTVLSTPPAHECCYNQL